MKDALRCYDPKVKLSLVEEVGEWLLKRKLAQRWAILLTATFIVSLLDFGTYGYQLSMAALYLAPISIACWTLDLKQAAYFTIAVAMLAAARYPILNSDPDFWIGVNNNLGRLISFGVNAAVVMGLKHTHDRVLFLARHDSMTGVLTRAAFVSELEAMSGKGRIAEMKMLLTYIDLDGFKAVNDRYGHAAGDAVLVAFAEASRGYLTAGELLGRLGGDEFATAVLVRDADVAAKVATETHAKLSAILQNCGYPVNCSMGALVIAADDQRSAEQLIAGADRLMYLAKQRGKGRLEISNRVSLEDDAYHEYHQNWQIAGGNLLSQPVGSRLVSARRS
jgi:diguanylate cyclase (GGDEF)-like protein